MRLTTKITIGFILSVFIIALAFIIAFSFSDRKNYKISSYSHDVITISEDHKTEMDAGTYKVVVFDKEQAGQEVHSYWFRDDCRLSFNPVTTESERNKLSIPEELADIIVANVSNDTLTIKVKMDELRRKYKNTNKSNVAISGFNLNLNTSTVDVINKIGILTEINNIKTDEIKVKAESDVSIYGCDANKLTVLEAGSLQIENCKLKELNLAHSKSWEVENCKIRVEPER